MPPFQLVPQSEQDSDNRAANTARMINCYLEPVGDKMVIKSVLGMSSFATIPGVFTRAMAEFGDVLYAVQGGSLYSIDEGGAETSLGAVADNSETTISSNGDSITVCANGRYFVWDGSVMSEPATGAFSDFGSVEYFGSLTVLTERNGQRVQWSDVLDPTTLDGLSFATANTFDDNILRSLAVGSSLWIFGTESIERWYQNGADLAPVAGGAVEFGLKSFGLLAKTPNGAFFVASDNKVRMVQGGMAPISNRAVETALAQNNATHCFFYQDEGHDFCVIRFSDRPAWAYDMSTARWHERAEGDPWEGWTATASARAYGKWHVATELGNVLQLERTNEDASGPLIRQITSSTLLNDGQRFRLRRFEVEGRVGHSNLGRDAQITLEMSRDHGETWSAPKVRSMGDQGDYMQRMVWRSLGQYRQATARLTISDAAELPVSNTVYADVA